MPGLLWIAAAAAAEPAPQAGERDPRPEIVVTGERVPRRLQETASSVAVAGKREIEAASADRVEQMLALVPNVQLGSGSQGPAIRGQDTTGALQALPAFLGGNRPRTTLIVDGRRDTYNELVFGAAPAWDIARIEVFRSPQTTTQGQNSIAGAIFVESSDPTFQPEYRARLIGGDYRTRQASAVMSGPISGDIAVRVAGDFRYSRTSNRIADKIEDGDPNHDVFGLARAKLLVRPRGLPGSNLELTYAHTQSQAPQVIQVTAPFKARRDESGLYGTFRINVDALTATAHHPLGTGLDLDVTATAGDSHARRLAFTGFGEARNDGRDWSGEAVLNWSPKGPLRAIAGISATKVKLRQFINLSRLNGSLGRFRDTQDSLGLFGEANLVVAPRTTLTAGLRYQQDQQQRSGAFGPPQQEVPLDYDRRFNAWLPKLSLAYDFSAAIRAGFLVQRAYNPGGTTLRFDIAQPDEFEAEHLWDYELFARAQLAGGFRASANLFYYDMKDAQRLKSIIVPAPGGLPVGFADLFNAPKARSYGAEAEVGWRPDERLSARLSVGLLRTKLIDAGPDYPDFDGNAFARSPRLSAAAAVDWAAAARLRLSAQGRYRDDYFSDDVNSPAVHIPAALIVDARAEYRIGRATGFVYVHNLLDKFALLDRTGDAVASVEEPRRVGIGIEAGF